MVATMKNAIFWDVMPHGMLPLLALLQYSDFSAVSPSVQ
jgi:hypothetical protein